jgi:hypothetical protein
MATNNATDNYTALTTKGDLYAYSTFSTRLPVGSNYYYPMADSSQTIGLSYQLPILQDQVASNTHIDFWGSNNGDGQVGTSANGTGATCAQAQSIDNAHLGILKMDMGTTTTGYAEVNSGTNLMALLGGSTLTIETCVYFNALSNGTDTYTFYFGCTDGTTGPTGNATNGVYISYSSGANSGNWVITSNVANVKTSTNTSSAPTAQTWYKLRLVITNKTSVTAYVGVAGSDLTAIGTVTATLTSVNLYPAWAFFQKSAGTTDTFGYLDYISSKTVYDSLR